MSNNLRLMLLIIGCCLVLGVYLWEIFRKRKRKKADILSAVDESDDISFTPNSDFSEEDYSKAISDLTELSNQLANSNSDTEHIISEMNEKNQENNIINDELNSAEKIKKENILVFYITATSEQFDGIIIKKILTDIGMKFGDMGIFHYYEDNKTNKYTNIEEYETVKSNQPLFSVSNMYEPGIFILDEMQKLKTKGIAAFMYDIDSPNSYKIFEKVFFVNVKNIAKSLNAEIKTSDYKLLDDITLQSITDELRLYAMKDFLKNGPK